VALLVGNVLRHAARVAPTRLAATLGDDGLTFSDFDTSSNRVAHALAGRGIGHGDRVAWWGDTALEALPIFGGLAKLGAVFAPVNARLGPAEATAVVGYASPRLLIVDAAHADLLDPIDVPVITHTDLADLAAGADTAEVRAPQLEEHDAHVIFFTSGSTGRPKGVVLSHRANVLRAFPALAAESDGGTVCMFPLFHMAGWSLALGAWARRSAIHFVPVPDADRLLQTVQRQRATRIYLIPAVWSRVLDRGIAGFDLSSLREADTGTSATPPELVDAIRQTLPHTVTRIFYGSTEAGPATVLPHADLARKPGSVGLPQAGVDVELTAEGEVRVRSELLMDGYFEQPDVTVEALRNGWYHTGDVGAFDDEGYLSIVGRARDIIRTGGETVAPTEVEVALATHPAVAEVAVVGVPDSKWGELVCAVIVLRPGVDAPTVSALRSHCDGQLAAFKQPRRVEAVDALPRTPATGQVQRTLLVERLQAHEGG
jgi:fatty-acyl-CoA synthase